MGERVRDIFQLSTNQCSFVVGCGIHAAYAARLLMERYSEKQKPLHIAFPDLFFKKAFDDVSREVMWYALRQNGVPEELVEWVHILFSSQERVWAPAIGSASYLRRYSPRLCPFPAHLHCHNRCHFKRPSETYSLDTIVCDDVLLPSNHKAELEQRWQAWNDRLATFELKLIVKKSEHFTTDLNEAGSIEISGTGS